MFWKKKENGQEKLPSPKGIPEAVGRYLVVSMGQDPNWVWNLKSVLRPRPGEKDLFDFRVFDGNNIGRQNFSVKNYDTLTDHPELILYEGTFSKKTFEVSLRERQRTASQAPPSQRVA
jgi:hypothetical protein